MTAITFSDFTKSYENMIAVDKLNLTIAEGEFFGFLGPNGAGKTSTIKALTGLSRITSGTIKVFGKNVVTQYKEARTFIGLVPQEYIFDNFLSVEQTMLYQAGYYGVPWQEAKKRAEPLLKTFGLFGKRKARPITLSGGMRKRLLIAKALIHKPKILILDEPTAGVDVELRYQLWQFLRDEAKKGTTIFLTTHYLEEAERLCKTIGVLHKGKLIAHDETNKLMHSLGSQMVILQFKDAFSDIPLPFKKFNAQRGQSSRELQIKLPSSDVLPNVLKTVYAHDLNLVDIHIHKEKLEDIFLKLTGSDA